MAERTLFEQILSGEIPSHKIGSGEGWYAFLDIFPRREGHTLVIPTTPVQRIAQLSEEQRSNLMTGVVEVQSRLSKHFETTDFTVLVHDGPLAGQEVPHVHVHVLPRTIGDDGSTIAAMWPNAPSREPDHAALSTLAARILDGTELIGCSSAAKEKRQFCPKWASRRVLVKGRHRRIEEFFHLHVRRGF